MQGRYSATASKVYRCRTECGRIIQKNSLLGVVIFEVLPGNIRNAQTAMKIQRCSYCSGTGRSCKCIDESGPQCQKFSILVDEWLMIIVHV